MANKTGKTWTGRQLPPGDSATPTGERGWSVSVLDDSGRTIGTRFIPAPEARDTKASR